MKIFIVKIGWIFFFSLLHPLISMALSGCDVTDITIGFVGTGKISSAMVRGFCSLPQRPKKILISKRNEMKASSLVAEVPEIISIAENDDIVRQSDVIFVGLLPSVAREVLPALPWKEGSKFVISMMAAVNFEEV